MPPKRNAGVTDTETQSLTWLTFLNSSCLSEEDIKEEFVEFGEVAECDGAIGGPEDGWVMVAMMKKAEAETAMAALKGRQESKVGGTLQMINLGGVESEEVDEVKKGEKLEEVKEEERLETFPKPVPAEKADVVVRTKKVEKTEMVEQELLSRGVENIAVGGNGD